MYGDDKTINRTSGHFSTYVMVQGAVCMSSECQIMHECEILCFFFRVVMTHALFFSIQDGLLNPFSSTQGEGLCVCHKILPLNL